jgi:hypothetical protein
MSGAVNHGTGSPNVMGLLPSAMGISLILMGALSENHRMAW